MDLEIDITLNAPDWRLHLEDPEQYIHEVIFHVLDQLDLEKFNTSFPVELSVLLCDQDEIQELNKTYREMDKPTNVLSFPSLTYRAPLDPDPLIGPVHLGDMALALGVLIREAQEQQIPLQAHFTHLVIHGFLHLLGYDHETEEEAELMETLEIRLLEQLSIANPYENKAF